MIELRASSANQWLTCAQRATHKLMTPVVNTGLPPSVHVATQLGSIVHEKITGDPAPHNLMITYDNITSTEREMHVQAKQIAEAVLREMADDTIIDREMELKATVKVFDTDITVTGHIDLAILTPDPNIIDIVDIKTGRLDQRFAWSQMSIYAWLLHHNDIFCRDVRIVWAPRGKMSKGRIYGNHVETMTRPAVDLIRQAESIIKHVARSWSNPIAIPGMHCLHCENIACVFNPQQDLV